MLTTELAFRQDGVQETIVAQPLSDTRLPLAELRLDIEQARKHLAALAPTAREFTFAAFDDQKGSKRRSPWIGGTIRSALDECWERIVEANRLGFGIFVTVQETNGENRNGECVKECRSVFYDDDSGDDAGLQLLKSLAPSLPSPNIFNRTSPGKSHRVWRVSPCTPAKFSECMARMAQCGSDPNAKDTARVLRLAGTFHLKNPAHPHLVTCEVPDGDGLFGDIDVQTLIDALPPVRETERAAPMPVSNERAAPPAGWSDDAAVAAGADAARAAGWGGELPIADFQEALNEHAEAGKPWPECARVIAAMAALPGSARQDWLDMLMILHKATGGSDAGLDVVNAWAAHVCPDKFDEMDAARVWKSLRTERKATLGLGTLFERAKSAGCVVPTPRASGFQPLATAASDGPDMSLLADQLPAPVCPLDVFGDLAPWIAQTADAKSTAPDWIVAGILATSAALIGMTRTVKVTDAWSEPCILWSLVVCEPSSRKSPALDVALDPLRALETTWAREFTPIKREWDIRRQRFDAETKAFNRRLEARARARAKPTNPADGDVHDIAPVAPDAPVQRRTIVSDVTTEKIADLLSKSPRGLLVSRDEFTAVFGNHDRYSKGGGGGDRAKFLELYGGRSASVDRVSRPDPIMVPYMAASMLGSIQPALFSQHLDPSKGDGFSARFIPFYADRPSAKSLLAAPPPADALAPVFRHLASLDFAPNATPVSVPLEDDALRIFDRWRMAHDVVVASAPSEALKHAYGKHDGLVARIALVLLYLDWASVGGTPWASIPGEYVARAIRFVDDYVKPMTLRTVGAEADGPAIKAARVIAKRIVAERPATVNFREIKRGYGARFEKHLPEAAAVLVEAGWISGPRKPDSGRTSTTYDVCQGLFH